MQEEENEINLNKPNLRNNLFRTNYKRQGGKTVEVGVLFILLKSENSIYLSSLDSFSKFSLENSCPCLSSSSVTSLDVTSFNPASYARQLK
jgi:hypothetical protein